MSSSDRVRYVLLIAFIPFLDNTIIPHIILNIYSSYLIYAILGAKYTSQALDEMLTKLQEMGYEIVPVSKLIMTEGYHMDANGMQIKD